MALSIFIIPYMLCTIYCSSTGIISTVYGLFLLFTGVREVLGICFSVIILVLLYNPYKGAFYET
jgi:hypothetical protein